MADFNLVVSTLTAKPPNSIPGQNFRLYSMHLFIDKVCTQLDSKGYLILSLSVAELDKVCTQFNGFQTLLPFSVTESVHNSRKSQLHNNNNTVHL